MSGYGLGADVGLALGGDFSAAVAQALADAHIDALAGRDQAAAEVVQLPCFEAQMALTEQLAALLGKGVDLDLDVTLCPHLASGVVAQLAGSDLKRTLGHDTARPGVVQNAFYRNARIALAADHSTPVVEALAGDVQALIGNDGTALVVQGRLLHHQAAAAAQGAFCTVVQRVGADGQGAICAELATPVVQLSGVNGDRCSAGELTFLVVQALGDLDVQGLVGGNRALAVVQ